MDSTLTLIGAGLAIGLAGLWVTLGEGMVASASLEAMGKNPDLEPTLKRITIIGIALVESAAIYGLLIAILILYTDWLSGYQAIAAGLAVWLPGLATGLGEWRAAQSAIRAILRNPDFEKQIFNNMILFIALVESAAIYGLLIAILTIYR